MAKHVTEAAGIGSEAVQAKTGKTWDQWFALLDKAGAKEWSHKEIARHLHDLCDCPGWWSQMVTVGYEQERGLRVKNQLCSGEFSASVSKTFAVPVASLFASWNDAKVRATWLPNSAKITIRKANLNKSMRITWHDETKVEINFWDKGPEKSQAAVEHRKLESQQDVARIKAYWSSALNHLKELLESEAARKPAAKTIRKKAAISKASK